MIRVPLLLKLFLLYACANQQPESQQAVVSAPRPASQVSPEDTLSVDLAESTVLWKGTKMRGAGKHEGKVRIKEGYLLTDSGGLTGGSFTIDMQSIAVTDIPAHEPVPRKRLVDHLKSDDFFSVEEYSTSRFTITGVERITSDSLRLQGNLTIKDITRNIAFDALRKDERFSATFTFDRFQWNIAYEGSWVDRTLVDRDIEMRIHLRVK